MLFGKNEKENIVHGLLCNLEGIVLLNLIVLNDIYTQLSINIENFLKLIHFLMNKNCYLHQYLPS